MHLRKWCRVSNLFRILCFQILFFVAVALAFVLYPHITLPFSNPWYITGPLTQQHYNPANNIFRFLLFVLAPLALLLFLSLFPKVRGLYSWLEAAPHELASMPVFSRGRILLPIGSLLYCVLMALNIPSYLSWGPTLDVFHEGETLGTSMTVLEGGAPYKDVIFVHGAFQDPIRSVAAFTLFHRSIGAVRTLDSAIKVLSFIVLFAFLFVLNKGRYLYAHLSFLILLMAIHIKALTVPPRDITTFSFLLAFLVLACAINKPRFQFSAGTAFAFLCFAFLPVVAMAYSIDRGYYLCATFCVLLPLILSGLPRRSLYLALAISFLGIALGLWILAIALHWEFRAFYDFTFLIMPRYKELMDGYIYPFRQPKYLLIVLLIAWNAYWVTAGILDAFHRRSVESKASGAFLFALRKQIVEFGLLFMSLCFFRSALGRADSIHVAYSLIITLILFMYLAIRYWLHGVLEKSRFLKVSFQYLLVCLVLVGSLYGTYRMEHRHLLPENFPLSKADADFLPGNYREGVAFLKANLSGNENFVTMTSEGAWYYLVGRSAPCRFPVVWFAMPPFYQQEVVHDLGANNVKIILYKSNSGWNKIDGFTWNERLPIVDRYIRDNYRYYATIADNEFWIRK